MKGETRMAEETDVIVVGAGLSGLVAATEITDAGKRAVVVDQEGEQSLGGQAEAHTGARTVFKEGIDYYAPAQGGYFLDAARGDFLE